ncbi:MAG: serine/threonine protein kinase [Thermoanaerobaculia bacterium]
MPDKIGKYEVSEQIGVGGFGTVFKGYDPFIKRTVAIKTCQLNDEEIKSRFFREAELAGNLHHRHITTIYDFGVENEIPYIVQEFLSGEDLDKKIKRGETIPLHRKVEILVAITEGLGYAHRHSIIHRDIKPGNIRVLEDGSVKIMDFGIAKSLATSSNLTQTGITLGTSAYLAPEQIRGDPLDGRTDIFALGVLAYELLTNRKPFRGEHLSTILYRILNEAPEPIQVTNPEVPSTLAAVVVRAIEKSPASRYASMEAMQQDLAGVYRQLTGSSARITIPPGTTDTAPSATGSVQPFDPETTHKTPSKGMGATRVTPRHITPPSGALARVPAPQDPTPPPGTTLTMGRGGLEVVNFRDPSQRGTGRATVEGPGKPEGTSRRGMWLAGATAVLISAGAGWYLTHQKASAPAASAPAPAASPAPALLTPAVFPQPIVGVDAPAPAPTAAPESKPGPAPKNDAPAIAKPARKYPVQFSSVPMATFSVDGEQIGPSVPARTLELEEGWHTARFEAPGLDPGLQRFSVGSRGVARVNYMFPVGMLVINAPEWAGANVLIDGKFKGVLVGEKRLQLKVGSYRVTLSREGVNPVTEQVDIPQGGSRSWTPPPPIPNAPGGGA